MDTLKKLFSNLVFVSTLFLVAGGLLLFAPQETLQVYIRLIGVLCLAGAAVGLLVELLFKKSPRSVPIIVVSCIAAVFGLVFLFAPGFVSAVLPFLFGIVLIVISAFELLSALQMPFGKLLTILLSAGGLALGILIVSNPNGLSSLMTRLIGVALIYEAVVGYVTAALVKTGHR